MLVVMRQGADKKQIEEVCQVIREMGLTPHPIPGKIRTAIGITGNLEPVNPAVISTLPGVAEVIRVTRSYKLTSREMKPEDTVVRVSDEVHFGGPGIAVIAGPCSVESREQTLGLAAKLRAAGAQVLRGGAFKPRTSPYAFQGLGREGLEILAEAREQTGLPVISEVLAVEDVDLVDQYVDIFQVGARNMQNFPLLRRLGRTRKPVMIKRGLAATLEEFLLAAEYVMAEGNRQVILCERGIRTFSDYTRFTLDLSIVPELKRVSHLPVVVDPSHAAGRRDIVIPLARAAIAAGADGIMVEVHDDPVRALSDGAQALTTDMFGELIEQVRAVGEAVGRAKVEARSAKSEIAAMRPGAG